MSEPVAADVDHVEGRTLIAPARRRIISERTRTVQWEDPAPACRPSGLHPGRRRRGGDVPADGRPSAEAIVGGFSDRPGMHLGGHSECRKSPVICKKCLVLMSQGKIPAHSRIR